MKLGQYSIHRQQLRPRIRKHYPVFALIFGIFCLNSCTFESQDIGIFEQVVTLAGKNREFGEPFGLALRNGEIYVSDGEKGRIFAIGSGGVTSTFAEGLDTPSAMAFDSKGNLIVADPGSHTIVSISSEGMPSTIAGATGISGSADGETSVARFNAPVGIAVGSDGRIFVSDTYNDRIRVIENGAVRTLAGSDRGYADGSGANAKFDTPLGIAVWNSDKLLVADSGNRRIRVVEQSGHVWTLAGNGAAEVIDGLLPQASLIAPTAIATSESGAIFVIDGNSIRVIGRRTFPVIETISSFRRGLNDGPAHTARFNRPSGLAVNGSGEIIVADGDNQLIRAFTDRKDLHPISDYETSRLRFSPEEFRNVQAARWPFDPPDARRDIAGTLGEIRGDLEDDSSQAWFHNGLDIAGGYGETARFIRSEKVLRPNAVENFATPRELIRMPTLGYIHLRLGRDKNEALFNDPRFLFDRDASGALTGLRIPRGARFDAGEPIGTLNAMNHVHLIAGRSGSEMNALAALEFPGIADSTLPTIESVSFYDENWREIETEPASNRIKLGGKARIVVRAYDRMDGNPERRRLGVYGVGFHVLDKVHQSNNVEWRITFDTLPEFDAVRFVYALKSKSGATGETIFNYIASNFVSGNDAKEEFLNTDELSRGNYFIRVEVRDYFGNTAFKEIPIEVLR